ncbi:hypothetical protein HY946_02100 [Candidatus Gottesmanbacteria bacterium]|nr:hypothetical protein [Candidatus Gottesmanbacteria bacterium]
MKEKIAKVIRRKASLITFVFDPTVIIPLFFAVLVSETGLTPSQIKVVLPLIFLVDVILPASLFFLFLREGWISDWEISKRKERINLYLIVCLLWFVGSGIAYFLGTDLLFKLHLIFTLAFLAGAVTTLFWKVSMHMLVDTTVVIILNFLFPGFWWLYLLLPIIAWSRFVRQKHTLAQLLGGFLLAIVVVWVGVNLAHL